MTITNTNSCITCTKPFKIIDQEQSFYTTQNLPTPAHCPNCRHKQRMALRSERALYKRTCGKCNESCLSTIPETAPYTVYCHKCFWEYIGLI